MNDGDVPDHVRGNVATIIEIEIIIVAGEVVIDDAEGAIDLMGV